MNSESTKLDPLGPDDLGDVGEAAFRALAAKGPLTINKSDRDRAGWDFVVQAPAENQLNSNLDDRTVLWTSYVQVKAAWKSRRPSVRLTLSAAEQLAKQKEAAFVAALMFDRTTVECVALYMVELTGERLAMILKALREHQRDGRRAVNDRRLQLYLRPEERLSDITGPAIRERLAQAHRDAGTNGYAARKTRELATIGYGERPIRGTITLHDIDRPALFDVLLGKRDWKASLSDFVETRFEVDLPARNAPSGMGRVRFVPHPKAKCELVVTSKGLRGQATFVGDHHVLTLPGPAGLESRSRCCFPALTVEVGDGRIRLQSWVSEKPALALADWRRFWRFLNAVKSNRTDFTLRSPQFSQPLQWRFDSLNVDAPSDIERRLMVVEAAYDLTEELNLDLGPLTMEEIARQATPIMIARYLGIPGQPRLTYSIESVHAQNEDYDSSPQDGVYADLIDLNGIRIAFAARVRMSCQASSDKPLWESSRARRLHLRRIDVSEDAFARFTQDAKTSAGLEKLFLGDIDDGFLRRSLGDIEEF